MEGTISLKELFLIFRKKMGLILIITIFSVMISATITYFYTTPIYESSTQLLVNQSKSSETMYNNNEVQTNLQLINTYNVIIKSPIILEEVIKQLKLDMSYEELNNSITISSKDESQVMTIFVQNKNPEMAVNIVNKIAKVFKKEIVSIMNVDNVKILASAIYSSDMAPVKPNKMLNLAIGGLLGIMLGVGLAFLFEFLDNTIKKEQDVETQLTLPLLGVIGFISGNSKAKNKRKMKARKGELDVS